MSNSAFPIGLALALAMASPSFSARPAVDLVWLDRIGMGANRTSATELEKLGEERFLDRQLGPSQPLPADVQAQIDTLAIERARSQAAFAVGVFKQGDVRRE